MKFQPQNVCSVSFLKTKRSRFLFAIVVFAQVYCLFICHSRFSSVELVIQLWQNKTTMRIYCVREWVSEWVIHAKWLNKKTVFIQISDFPLRIHFHAEFFQINLRLVMRKSRKFSHSPVNTTYLHLFSIFPIKDIMLTRRLRANNSMDIYLAKTPIRYVSIRWNVQFSMNINSNVKLHE